MLTLMRNGGFSMYFILAFGLTALIAAGRFALRPRTTPRGFATSMSVVTLYATLGGVATDVGATLFAVAHALDAQQADAPAMLCQGLAESTSPAIVGFGLLAMVALLDAIGRRTLGAGGDAVQRPSA